jgi:uncharacterized protein (TIGR02453 family)
MLKPSTLQFLKDLKKNNNKLWFDAHRTEYEAAKNDFAEFIQKVIGLFAKTDPTISHLKAKDCLFRINRDVRFSKDKSPYKTNFGAYINPDGKKSMKAGYYFHLEPGNSFMGGGMWQPASEIVKKVRQEIDYNLAEFKKILSSKKIKSIYDGLFIEEGQLLSKVPKGYDPDNPAAEYLKHKSYVTLANIRDGELIDENLTSNTIKAFEAILPLIAFLNKGID